MRSALTSTRDAYVILAQSVPQVLTVSNPLKLSITSNASGSGPSGRPSSWPKAADFDEQLKSLFWTKTFWKEFKDAMQGSSSLTATTGKRGRHCAANGINVKMLYVVDITGKPVDGHRAGIIREAAREIWKHLSKAGKAPEQWKTDVPVDTADTYKYEMAHRFEELRLCDNGWKAEQIAVDNYPSWRTNRIKARKFNLIKVSDTGAETDSSEDEKSGDARSDDGTPKDKGKGKQKVEEKAEIPVAKKHKSGNGKAASSAKQPAIKVSSP
jgi:hypothetical protein